MRQEGKGRRKRWDCELVGFFCGPWDDISKSLFWEMAV